MSNLPMAPYCASINVRKQVNALRLVVVLLSAFFIASCSSDDDNATETSNVTNNEVTRDSGIVVTKQEASGITVHTLTAPESVFANSTHLIESENSLVAIDAQFLLPNAADMRAYADEIGKPIDRVFITHEHPDHFLGSEAFKDIPIFALQEVSDAIAAAGQDEVDEKQAQFGPDAIASTFVVPEYVEAGTIEIDSISYELSKVLDAEAAVQLVVKIPNHGVIAAGDIVYSGVHLILAGQPAPWTTALQDLGATGDQYPIVLAGHGKPAAPAVFDENIAWLAKAQELLAVTDATFDDFKQGLIDEFPQLGMQAAIDFVQPILFPAPTATEIKQAINVFTNAGVTNGVPLTIDAKGPATIGADVEFPGFAFGVYDVDVTPSTLKMTLAIDPSSLQVDTYDSETKDLYYYEFDREVSSASISSAAEGFVATVEVVAPGEMVTTNGAFSEELATSYTLTNGGILVTIGEGSALRTVGQGGSLSVDMVFK